MRHSAYLLVSCLGLSQATWATDDARFKPLTVNDGTPVAMQTPKITDADPAFTLKFHNLKINASASQPEFG